MFTVEKIRLGAVAPAFDKDGKLESVSLMDGMEVPDSYGIYRTDTKQCLGVVGSRYVPVQNEKLHGIVLEAAELAGLGGHDVKFLELDRGAKVSFQVQLPEWDLKGDKVRRWASALNSHDGSSSLALGLVGTRIICSNTWVTAYRGCSKARHSASVTETIKVLSNELMESIEKDKNEFLEMQHLQSLSYTDKDHSKFIKELIGYDLKDLEMERVKLPELNTTKRENKFRAISDSINVELESAGQTLWGVFNGVTRYTNHVEAVKKADPNAYLYFGSGRELVERALSIVSEN